MRQVKRALIIATVALSLVTICLVMAWPKMRQAKVTARVSSLHILRTYLLRELEHSGRLPDQLVDLRDHSGTHIVDMLPPTIDRGRLRYSHAALVWISYSDSTGEYEVTKEGVVWSRSP